MEETKFTLETTVVGTADGRETYEVRKKFSTEGKTAILIALYPTVSMLNPMITDTSTMHLLNHVHEMGYNEIRITNIFSTVFGRKPSAKQLHESEENMQYVENLIEESDKTKTDFIVAWGSSLGKNANANGIKVRILQMLLDKGWEKM